jgi:hypothetical protein
MRVPDFKAPPLACDTHIFGPNHVSGGRHLGIANINERMRVEFIEQE